MGTSCTFKGAANEQKEEVMWAKEYLKIKSVCAVPPTGEIRECDGDGGRITLGATLLLTEVSAPSLESTRGRSGRSIFI